MAAPVAEADTTSNVATTNNNIEARACPYTGWFQCINVQTNLCIAQCAWAGRRSAVCLSGCSANANSACGAYGCGQCPLTGLNRGPSHVEQVRVRRSTTEPKGLSEIFQHHGRPYCATQRERA
ncbi:hypothetical protein CLIM01_14684 [Colletotrichum limetticola]|uniref:Uncharacterized protein n=1 Tax=Colletotrichum limetticola TaxID=1209924 RepID=A0ABQ9P773_9PEZI|nr:hypothetical protein CLIM01_14684 [Colletotrichum limetticola]